MGKRKRSKRRRDKRARSRRRKRAKALAVHTQAGQVVTRFQVRVEQLELARGHDGFLRGMPEPVLILGVYCMDKRGPWLAGRYLYRFKAPTGFPTKVPTIEPSNEQAIVVHDSPASFALVALAVEEDSGRGVQTLFASLERADTLVAWAEDSDAPTPLHLVELAHGWPNVDQGRRVNLMLDGMDPSQSLPGDDWIAARILITDDNPRRRQQFRLHFVSADKRNDWTAELEIALRRG